MKRWMNVLNRGAEVFARFVLFCMEKAEPATRKVEPIWGKISSFCRTHKAVTGVCAVLLLAALVCGDYLLKPYWNFTPFTNWKRYTSSRGDYIQFLSPEQASQYQYMIGLDIYEGYGYNFKRMWCGLEGIPRVLCKAKVIAVRDVVHVKKGYKVPHPNPREQVGGSENRMNSDFESIVLLEVEKVFFDPDQTLTKNLIRVYSMASAIENTGYSSTYPPLIVGDTYYLTMIPVKSLWPDGKGLGTEYYPYYAIKELQYEAMAPFFYENVDYLICKEYFNKWVALDNEVYAPSNLGRVARERGINLQGERFDEDDRFSTLKYEKYKEVEMDEALRELLEPIEQEWMNTERIFNRARINAYPEPR